MLSHLTISQYRGFKEFAVTGLAQVNLFVGKNNSGKSALLEAVHFLASGGDPAVLVGAATERGETLPGEFEELSFVDVSHFFFGHDIRPGSKFSVSSANGFPSVSAEVREIRDFDEFPDDLPGNFRPALALQIDGGASTAPKQSRTFLLSQEGALLDSRRSRRLLFREERTEGPGIVMIPPDSLPAMRLSRMWRPIINAKREEDVHRAMRILGGPDLVDIVFAPSGESSGDRSGILVSFKNDTHRVPLGSMGDGMRRLLALAISLIHAKGGVLIIDEIDTGFHYSIMAKMWELVVKTAAESGVQVFATTHSADCIRGLGVLCKRNPDIKALVAAHKIERDRQRSVNFSGEEILNAIEEDIEIR